MVEDAVDSTASPAPAAASLPPQKGPSKRKRLPAGSCVAANVVLGRKSSRLLSSSIYGNQEKPEDDFIGGILSKMTAGFGGGSISDSIRSSATMHDRVTHNASKMAKAAQEMDERTRGSFGKETWMCKGCGTTDKSVLELNAERSFVHCSVCGASDGGTNAVANPFEKTTSYQHIEEEEERDVANLVLNTRDAKERRLVRQSSASGSCVGNASSASGIARTHASVSRASVQSSNHGEAALSAHQRTKRDAVVVEIYDVIRKAGRNPDTCPIFKCASSVASNTFVKASCHASICKTRPPTCPGALCDRLPKYIAREAVCQILEEATKDATLSGSFKMLSREDVQNATNAISPILSSYTSKASVRNVISAEFTFSKSATPDCISNECAVPTQHPTGEVASSSDATTDHSNDEKLAAWRKNLSESFGALKDMNMINRDCYRAALKIVTSFEHREWLNKVVEFPPDLVCLMVSTRVAGETCTPNIRSMLQELAKRQGLSMVSLKSLVDEIVVT